MYRNTLSLDPTRQRRLLQVLSPRPLHYPLPSLVPRQEQKFVQKPPNLKKKMTTLKHQVTQKNQIIKNPNGLFVEPCVPELDNVGAPFFQCFFDTKAVDQFRAMISLITNIGTQFRLLKRTPTTDDPTTSRKRKTTISPEETKKQSIIEAIQFCIGDVIRYKLIDPSTTSKTKEDKFSSIAATTKYFKGDDYSDRFNDYYQIIGIEVQKKAVTKFTNEPGLLVQEYVWSIRNIIKGYQTYIPIRKLEDLYEANYFESGWVNWTKKNYYPHGKVQSIPSGYWVSNTIDATSQKEEAANFKSYFTPQEQEQWNRFMDKIFLSDWKHNLLGETFTWTEYFLSQPSKKSTTLETRKTTLLYQIIGGIPWMEFNYTKNSSNGGDNSYSEYIYTPAFKTINLKTNTVRYFSITCSEFCKKMLFPEQIIDNIKNYLVKKTRHHHNKKNCCQQLSSSVVDYSQLSFKKKIEETNNRKEKEDSKSSSPFTNNYQQNKKQKVN